jgi:hypothetical protein
VQNKNFPIAKAERRVFKKPKDAPRNKLTRPIGFLNLGAPH